MKQALITLSFLLMTATAPSRNVEHTEPMADSVAVEDTYTIDTLEAMVYAFAMVESRGNHLAHNERENAVGLLQIRPIMVMEANRIVGEDIYTLDDRWDAEVSIEIFRTVMERHNPTLDIDKAIDIWNPRCGEKYRQSVKNEYEKVKGGEE